MMKGMMRRGQTQIYFLILGIIFLVIVMALTGSIQAFATGAAQQAGLPVEVVDLVNLTPFFADAIIIVGIIVAVARPGVGF